MIKPVIAILCAASLIALGGCSSTPGPKYRAVGSYSEGLAAVQSPSGKWGFIDGQQQWVIPPRFDDAKPFQGDRAAVKQNGKWGFINRRGDWQ